MNLLFESVAQLFGRSPHKPTPEEISAPAQEIHRLKRIEKADLESIRKEHELSSKRHFWRNRRWLVLLATNLLFVLSYQLDIQLLEGALTASRFLGFHMADLNSSLQVMLAFKHVLINLLIGTVTIAVLWLLLGGRTFCSWVCPYHLVAEWTEKLHLKLVEKKIIQGRDFHRGVRTVFYVVFALLAIVTGYTVFETVSPTGILSRALIYGPGLAMAWVVALLAFEVLVSRRAWCRYVCPVGLTYGLVGVFSPVRVVYNLEHCRHEGECRKVCMVPHVLEPVIKGRASDVKIPLGADCTRCGLCIDTCPTGALKFEIKGLSKML